MSVWVLDTDMVTLLQHGQASVCQRAASHSPQDLAISIVTVEEMLSGWYTRIRQAKDDARLIRAYSALQQAVRFANSVRILAIDQQALQQFHDLKAIPVRIGTNDLRIGSTALVHGAVLVTRNTADFSKIPGLVLEDWS